MNVYQRVCDIIQREMGLSDDQVYLFNEKFDIPTDERLYVAVGVGETTVIGTKSDLDASGNEVKAGIFQVPLRIEVLSRRDDALTRKEEVFLAIQSNFSRNQQLQYGFGLFPQGMFMNTSGVDGAAIPYRFSGHVTLQYTVSKTQSTPFYDTVQSAEIHTEA